MNDDKQGGFVKRLCRKVLGWLPAVLHAIRKPCIDTKLGVFDETETLQPQLSFCITYRNRFEHITETLPVNLEHNRADSDSIEFVIVQFGGEEDLLPWLKSHYAEDLATGYLKFFNTDKMGDWHMCIAKNTAHNMASGKILTNLDSDNFTGDRGGRLVIEQLAQQNQASLIWQWAGERGDGTAGRVSMTRTLFNAIGGYDEGLGATTQEDIDLINRLRTQGVKVVAIRDKIFSYAIQHEFALGIALNQGEIARLTEENRKKSIHNMLKGNVVANSSRNIGVSANRFVIEQKSFS